MLSRGAAGEACAFALVGHAAPSRTGAVARATAPARQAPVRAARVATRRVAPVLCHKRCALGRHRPGVVAPAVHARRPGFGARHAPRATLVAPDATWAVWTTLLVAATGGIVSEQTRVGAALSAPLVSTLAGLVLCNTGVLPASALAYDVVNKLLVPFSIPMLLFNADLRRVLRDTGRLLQAFAIGAVGTVVGTVVASAAMPLAPTLGADAIKVVSALNARHIGGAVNFVAVAEALQMSPNVVASALAADNIVVALYFTLLFALAKGSDTNGDRGAAADDVDSAACTANDESVRKVGNGADSITLRSMCVALTVSAALCLAARALATALHAPGMFISLLTLLVVALATAFPSWCRRLQASGTAMGVLMMQIFFAVTGASGSVKAVLATAPSLFVFSTIQVLVHLAVTLAMGRRVLRIDTRELLLASNACVGGPTTAAGMAAAKKWHALTVPAILVGICGYATASFLSLALASLLPRVLSFVSVVPATATVVRSAAALRTFVAISGAAAVR